MADLAFASPLMTRPDDLATVGDEERRLTRPDRMQADLALFRLDELRFSGAGDPLAALVLCGASRADRVMVQGRWLVENGTIPGLDLDRLRREHGAAARTLLTS